MSEAVKGEKNYFYNKHYTGEQHPFYGKHHSQEAKEKMRVAKKDGKAPTAKKVAIYDENMNFIKAFETQCLLKIYLGLSPNGSTDTLKNILNRIKCIMDIM